MPGDLEAADEVFITSTTRDLLAVRQVEDKKVGRNDRVRKALAEGFADYLRNYVASHKAVAA
jgi:branched-chain amino acid aminotransferase